MRLDNYDDRWEVKTRPHHFHIRGMQSVIKSPRIDEPRQDIGKIFKIIFKNLRKKKYQSEVLENLDFGLDLFDLDELKLD